MNTLTPPWHKYPNRPISSDFWLDGDGADYIQTYIEWFRSINASSERSTIALDVHPLPKGWIISNIYTTTPPDPHDHAMYGELDHTAVKQALQAAEAVRPVVCASIYRSGYDGQELLQISNEHIDIESNQGAEDLISGTAGKSILHAVKFLSQLSTELDKRYVYHSLELFNADGECVKAFKGGPE